MSKTLTGNFDKIIKRINDLVSSPFVARRIIAKGTKVLFAIAAVYPPETARNSPPGIRGDGRWYQRGHGTRYTKRNSQIGGTPFYQNIGQGGGSQRLQQSWKIENADFTGAVYTGVTYAPFLYDEKLRPAWVREVGWQTLGDIEKEFAPKFEKLAVEEIEKEITK